MKTGRYSIKELLTHNEIEQIIIPEIQRDYVWETSNVSKLIDDIYKNYEKKISHQLEIKVNGFLENNNTVTEFLTKEYERLKYHQKLGFIYAYHDRDYVGKFFLIDGQQRLTTIFLILLFLYRELKKVDSFRSFYFNSEIPKVNYKIREQSNDFLKLLIESELNGAAYQNSEQFYKAEYTKDITIAHLISNYEQIKLQIGSIENKANFLQYLEDFVEVNYFDTHLSEQGEQLYIYMNSRGEQLSFQEIIRAELMQTITESEKKIELGNEWEKWQNFFWRHRGKNENADKGFEEFLKWASIINICLSENPDIFRKQVKDKLQTTKEAKENYIHRKGDLAIEQRDLLFKYQTTYIAYDFLSELFNATATLYSLDSKYILSKDEWLSNNLSTIDYVILLPLLVYIKQNQWEDDSELVQDVERVSMFLKNVTYFEGVSKNPDASLIDLIELISKLIGSEKDITLLGNIEGYKTILTDNEKYKFTKYKLSAEQRKKTEEFVWDISLDKSFSDFLMGDISSLFKCHDLKIEKTNPSQSSSLSILNSLKIKFKELIFENRNSDKLRRVLLTYYDFSQEIGNSNLGLCKYSFVCTNGDLWNIRKEWKEVFAEGEFMEMILDVLSLNINEINSLLKDRVKNYKGKSWEEAFIKDPNIFKYCGNKKILWDTKDRILLLSQTNYSIDGSREIQCQLLSSKFTSEEMRVYRNNCCFLDISVNEESQTFEVKKSDHEFALDFTFESNEMTWYFNLFHRNYEIKDLIDLTKFPQWKQSGDRITIEEGLIYSHDILKSLMENTDALEIIIRELLEVEIMPVLQEINSTYILEK